MRDRTADDERARRADGDEWRMRTGAGQGDVPACLLPRDDGEAALIALWEATLGAAPERPDDDFFDQGGDSLLAIALCERIRQATGATLDFNTLIAEPTFARIARALGAATGGTPAPTPIPLRLGGGGVPLFLLPGAGGSAFGLRRFALALGPGRAIFGLRYPDVDPAGGDLPRIEGLAADFLGQIRRLRPAGPYLLGGYSFGGRVAFEIARRLVADGDGVDLLALFDTYGPGFPRIRPLHRRLREHADALRRLDHRRRWGYLAARGRRAAAYCERVVSRLTPGVRFLVPAPIRADFDWHRDASARYRPGVYPGRVTLFRAREQPRMLGADYDDPLLGWGPLAAGGVAVREVPGAHLTLFDEENVGALAGAVGCCLT